MWCTWPKSVVHTNMFFSTPRFWGFPIQTHIEKCVFCGVYSHHILDFSLDWTIRYSVFFMESTGWIWGQHWIGIDKHIYKYLQTILIDLDIDEPCITLLSILKISPKQPPQIHIFTRLLRLQSLHQLPKASDLLLGGSMYVTERRTSLPQKSSH